MSLLFLIAIPLAGGLAAWAAGHWNVRLPKWIAIAALLANLILLAAAWGGRNEGPWPLSVQVPWMPAIGASIRLGMDGISFLLVILTLLLGLASVSCSWTEIRERLGFYYLNILWVLAGALGVFLSLDLLLFFFFWELMLIPMFMLILVWGHEDRSRSAIKFFLFTQVTGLMMAVSILGLYFMNARATGAFTFDYEGWLATSVGPRAGVWLMAGFLIAFAVKLPAVPFHTWLPDAHTQAPTAGSVILAGVLLKTGAYGLIRFAVPLFPAAVHSFAPVAMFLGVAGILYGAALSFAQHDFKRLVAYTSVSHMGFVLLAAFAGNALAIQGAVIQMVCHGLSTGGLFILAGILQERLHTRDIRQMQGLWQSAPRAGGLALVLALASLGLPGLGNFIGEILILLGVFQTHPWAAVCAAFGLVASTIYAMAIMQRVFFGAAGDRSRMTDLNVREFTSLIALVLGLVFLGVYPQWALHLSDRPAAAVAERWASGEDKQAGAPHGEVLEDTR